MLVVAEQMTALARIEGVALYDDAAASLAQRQNASLHRLRRSPSKLLHWKLQKPDERDEKSTPVTASLLAPEPAAFIAYAELDVLPASTCAALIRCESSPPV